MTALCGGATSSGKPDYNRFVQISSYAVGALLNNVSTVWAVPLAAVIGLVNYDLQEFCTTDPPAMPTITASDVVDVLSPLQGPAYFAARQKFQDMIANYAWPQFCKCDSGPQPATPAPLPAPTGMPNLDPVTPLTPDPSAASPCYVWCQTCDNNLHGVAFDGGTTFPAFSVAGRVLSGMTGVNIKLNWNRPFGSGTVIVTVAVIVNDRAGTNIHTYSMGAVSSAADTEYFVPLTPDAYTFQVRFTSPSGIPSTQNVDVNADGYCAGTQPGGTDQGCCPPDPTVLAILNNIQGMVTLIQRQQVPFAYVLGPAHSGLTGNGQISVSGLLGIKLEVDSYGSAVGQIAGDPTEFYDAGWFSWGGPDGFSRREFITHSPQVSLPAAAGQYTSLGYSLGHDVEVTITELVRES